MPAQILTTVEDLTEAIKDAEERMTVLLDKGGYLWWSEVDAFGIPELHGVAGPQRPGERGMAVQAYLNIMAPVEAVHYGPFTVIHRNAAD